MSPRILMMGTPDFAVPSLQALVREKYDVIGVVTQPDRPKGRKRILSPPPLKQEALKLGLTVYQPERLRNPEGIRKIRELAPDLIITAAYGQILPSEILDIPRFGSINVHASLLPRYRGGAPIHHALMAGEEETGVTIMYMVQQLDAGDMLAQRSIRIGADDDVGTLHDKLSLLGAELLTELLPRLLEGKVTAVPQDQEQVTYAPNITREDERIDWSRGAGDICDQIRGLRPWPVAFTTWQGEPLKIWKANKVDHRGQEEPGTILQADEKGIVVVAGVGAVVLTELQPAGKKAMSVEQFVRGRRLKPGERLGDLS